MPTKFTMSFTMDNAAFHDPEGSYGDECKRILEMVAIRARVHTGGKILDVNGNSIGYWRVR